MGRVGVVASCSSGFGRQVAEKMASLGDRVNATTRCPSDGHALAGSYPPGGSRNSGRNRRNVRSDLQRLPRYG